MSAHRGAVEDLATPHAFIEALPGVYRAPELAGPDGGRFFAEFMGAFDEGHAPVHATLDNLQAYLDPALTPADFLRWLATWVGIDTDQGSSTTRLRQLVSEAAAEHGRRGTAAGIVWSVFAVTGHHVDLVDSGGTVASTEAGATLPGNAIPHLTVRVPSAAQDSLDAIEAAVTAAKPAHVPHSMELVQ